MKIKSVVVMAYALTTMSLASAQSNSSLSFNHGNWEIYCNPTGTCQAAGYQQDDNDSLPASILLTRKAGAQQTVKAEVALSYWGEDFKQAQFENIHLYLNNKDLGKVNLDITDLPLQGKLTATQSQAILKNVTQKQQIIFKNKYHSWQVSDQGMTAILLKMDDFQKRLDTVGALVKKGSKNENQVLAAQPALQVKRIKTANQPYQTISWNKLDSQLKNKLINSLDKDVECEGVYMDGKFERQDIEFYKLTQQKILIKTLCWRAAYNEGHGVWLMDEKLTQKPKFITASASEIESGQIFSYQKSRGVGDCASVEQWTWNGKDMIKTQDRWGGMCKGLGMGGIWDLKLIDAQVK